MESNKHLSDLLSEFKTGMLVTRSAGALHARPMAVVGLSTGPSIYLATNIASPKIGEIEFDPAVAMTFQANHQFVSLHGSAHVNRDRALIDKLWSDNWATWFPKGKEDPDLCLLEIEPVAGEYWDNSGTTGVRYVIDGMRAVFDEATPNNDKSQQAKVGVQ